ncbi:peptide chain release factor N(5)-glutamine methyltransferase [Candidatus Daviesbacteria bacterium]|nr:peptide chain release factor N(5)-glutamine methyltransferase [Candidatus Daviesbacteria bacterium]
MKRGSTLKEEIKKVQKLAPPRQYQQGWTEFYEQSSRTHIPPVQYQRGWCEFYKLKFKLTPDVLIPRPETELLVDEVIKIKPNTILDIGTGSGCVAISIAKNLPNAKIIATDISPKALGVAKSNAKFHHVEDKIIFLEADLLPDFKQSPDVIVTNLPYIPTARLMYIDPMVTEFEPRVALDGGQDGFELYRKLFQQISEMRKGVKLNHPEGGKLKYLIGEIDYTHGELAVQEALKYFPNAEVEVTKDLAHLQRILKIKF